MNPCVPCKMRMMLILRLLSATDRRYRALIQQSYVQATTKLRFCPHPGCTETVLCASGSGAFHSPAEQAHTVQCGQGHSFCFSCGNDDHRPLLCQFVNIWHKSAKDDAGTSQWLKAHTKSCPKCRNNIEKNGGCKYVLFFFLLPQLRLYISPT